MAVQKNGGIPIGINAPIATLNTSIAGKATITTVFAIANTTRTWLKMPQTTAGTYQCVTSTGTATIFVYDTSYDLVQELSITSTASNQVITSDFHRLEVVASGALDLSITPSQAKVSDAGGTMTLTTITGTGNFAQGTGTAAGGTSGYAAGQYAHVIVVGPGGGGGGQGRATNPQGNFSSPGGAGGSGGVSATTTALALTGTYAVTIGTGGNAGSNGGQGSAGTSGNAGSGATTGFTFTSNAGAAGPGNPSSSSGSSMPAGAQGSPALPANTDIYLTTTYGELGGGAGGTAGGVPSSDAAPQAGQGGRILVLRWTP